MDVNQRMKELAEYIRMNEELTTTIDAIKDELKEYMKKNGMEVLQGLEHKASYKQVSSARIDTTALKQEQPTIAQQYTRTTITNRFTFA